MQALRIRDIIGPIMVGPSSSHTAGAVRIALMARRLFQVAPKRVEFELYGSFAQTYKGHGTDRALVAGILGFDVDDARIRDSLFLAQQAGIEVRFTPIPDGECDHPNTVEVVMTAGDGKVLRVRGESIGGGSATVSRIDGLDVLITGQHNSLIITQKDEPGVLAHISTCISGYDINIASARMYRKGRGEAAYTVMETDAPLPDALLAAIGESPAIDEVRAIPADSLDEAGSTDVADASCEKRFEALDFPNGEALLAYCEREGKPISAAFLEREEALDGCHGRQTSAMDYLDRVLATMRDAAHLPECEPLPSAGGLIGGEAAKLKALAKSGRSLSEGQVATLTRYALATLETNAAMGRIVAAPTAGSSGVIPAVLLTLAEGYGLDDDDLKRGLVTAAAIGNIIARNATVSGAEGGCQAEIGSAAAMAAAAAVELGGGTPAQCLAAAANALTNLMGLVCDPVGGFVEVPCQKRNAIGAANALISADIALAGIGNLVGFDETVDAMFKVGRSLPMELRETALGGIAAAPSACDWCTGCR